MKYIVSISLLFLLQSCIPSSAYLVNEYTNFPKGLNNKEFEMEVANRNQLLNSQQDAVVPFSELGKKKKLHFELMYFRRTFIPKKNVKEVDSLVNELIAIPKRAWIWDTMYDKIYGLKGTIWIKKDIQIKTNQKVEKIMTELSQRIQFKYDKSDYEVYKLYNNVYTKRNVNHQQKVD
jgi:hypothetical protein